jgi:hypothetical protein
MGLLLWGLLATGFLTTALRASQAAHLTRLDIPYLLGTALTEDRDRAKVYGFLVHFVNGWILASLYRGFFGGFGVSSWWLGGLMGVAHAAFVLCVVVPLLPAFHPRMASETEGPDPTRLLEPPGFLALNYGRRTAAATLLAHVGYGAILGATYRL